MASIERLLTLGQALGAEARRRDGTGGMRWEDVSRALCMIDREERAALCLGPRPDLVTAAEREALRTALTMRLARHDSRAGTYADPRRAMQCQARIVATVLAEFLDPKVCASCRGHGAVAVSSGRHRGVVTKECERCSGKGWCAWGANQRARTARLSRGEWNEKYAPGYERVLDYLRTLQQMAVGNVMRALFGSDEERDARVG